MWPDNILHRLLHPLARASARAPVDGEARRPGGEAEADERETKETESKSGQSGMHKHARFEQLVKAYSGWLYRYAYWLAGDRQTAEDLVQETFLRAFRFFDSLKDEKAAKSWLTTILRRENARRFERKRIEMADVELDTIPSEFVDFDARPETLALRHALRMLPDKYREPLVLQVLQGFSLEDIAQLTSLPRNTVATRLHRARQKLKKLLTDDLKDAL